MPRFQAVDPWLRFWRFVEKTPTCWLWIGSCSTNGYGQLRVNGRLVQAHRWLFETLIGPIPPGYEPDHVCRVRNCVNLEDLILKTHREYLERQYDCGPICLPHPL